MGGAVPAGAGGAGHLNGSSPSEIAANPPHIAGVCRPEGAEAPPLLRPDEHVGGELKHRQAEQQGERPGEQGEAQKQEEVFR